ncbi:hypothetical protein DID88_004037 [Monilinia fructigena]|uniref:Uncharacterized protein n=1 Tax=Monilinia fructigena TaxID=38457 RepID=A0A395ITH3_9HELO|nr:hypothetical protein DID88_004037 [Monilinia fructigena]
MTFPPPPSTQSTGMTLASNSVKSMDTSNPITPSKLANGLPQNSSPILTFVFMALPQLGLNPPEEYTFCVYVLPVGVYHGVHPVKALILEGFDRSAPYGTGSAKVGGNYAPVLRWSDKARNEGYGITLHLDRGEDITLVVPDSKNVIASVTSDSILEIGKSFGWKTEVRSIKYEESPPSPK